MRTQQIAPLTPLGMRRRRRVRRVAFFAVVILLMGFAGALAARMWLRHAMEAALPQVQGELRVSGLSAPVRVERDAHGVPHVMARTMDDLVFAQGFVTAQDRLWQMDMLRRHAAGELAEVLGRGLVEHDRAQRYLQLRAVADRSLPGMNAEERRALERYADGVNAEMAAAAGHLPAEFRLLGYAPKPWAARDSLLVGFAMSEDLSTEYPEKLNREAVAAKLAEAGAGDLMAELYPVGSWRDHPPAEGKPDLTAPREMIDIPLDDSQASTGGRRSSGGVGGAQGLLQVPEAAGGDPSRGPVHATSSSDGVTGPLERSRIRTSQLLSAEHAEDLEKARAVLGKSVSGLGCEGCAAGSNNWVVSGARTASGKPMVANDMHLSVTLPGIWYTADLEAVGNSDAGSAARGFHVSGVTLPGVPFVVVGHNAHVAWGFTNSGADVQDLYVEQVEGDQFRAADGSMQPLVHQAETIRVKRGMDVVLDVRETRHGEALTPVVSPMFAHETRALALRWSLYEPGYASMPFGRVNAAASGAELAAAFARFGGPSQNLIWGDDAGHIGYHLVGMVPLRGPNGQSGLSPVPVNAGTYEWTGFIPYEQLPLVTDPAGGVLATANARITPETYPFPIALDWDLPYRNERIWKWLGERTGMDAAAMTALQNDTFSALDKTVAERVAYAVDHAKAPSKRAREAADLLRGWDGRVRVNSAEANVTQAVRVALLPMLLEPKLGKAWPLYTWRERSYAVEMIAERGGGKWLPEAYGDWNEFLTAVLERGLKDGGAPGRLAKWSWGSTHRMELQHPVFGSAWYLRWMSGQTGTRAVPLPGNAFTVRAFSGVHAASERFVADLGDVDRATMTLPQGESGEVGSDWYVDQWPAWTSGVGVPLAFSSGTRGRNGTGSEAGPAGDRAAQALVLLPR